MTDERPDHIEPDPALDRLVLAAADLESRDDVAVDEAALANYLLGTATPEEKAQIQAALLRSARLREDMAQLLRDMEEVSSPATLADPTVEMPSIPSYAAAKERAQATVSPRPERARPVLVQRAGRSTTAHWWDRLLTPQFGWGLAAAAAIGFVFLVTNRDGIRDLPVAETAIVRLHGAEAFGPGSRGEIETIHASSHLEAAQLALGQCIAWEEDGFHTRDLATRSAPPGHTRSVEVVMLDAQNQVVARIKGAVPVESPPDAIHCWIALLPAAAKPEIPLQDLRMAGDRVRFSWSAELGSSGCAVFTYPSESGFSVSLPQSVQLSAAR